MLPLLRMPSARSTGGQANQRRANGPQRRRRLAMILAIMIAVLLALWRQVAE